ncbi:GMP/IMP nucleotidase [Microbulbifer yueqingensis]|uniref:Putative hydrolase of the HAD superfamily n=1 Tax=Microbulbifer yueqingensis TaxID=658219 RepID=A0A1G9DD68_9GAMM|nr:GMP/IMP nucleotidase [Microbulbifer yueqingensis]SDK61803.1 putative hydrolase of the HAD superfamily [Microbulbifer yueqingensis]
MLDWQDVDTVMLDMDGTLLDLHYDNHFWLTHLPQRYAQTHGLNLQEAEEQLVKQIDSRRGTLEWYCLNFWSRELQLDIPAVLREIEDRIALRPQTQAFLEALRQMEKHVLLVTNAHPDGLAHKLEITGIDRWMDGIISSHELNHAKESTHFWSALREYVEFEPDRTLFVDDNEHVLAAARDYGIGHLVCIRQPDSRGPLRDITDFPAIHHFEEILAL